MESNLITVPNPDLVVWVICPDIQHHRDSIQPNRTNLIERTQPWHIPQPAVSFCPTPFASILCELPGASLKAFYSIKRQTLDATSPKERHGVASPGGSNI